MTCLPQPFCNNRYGAHAAAASTRPCWQRAWHTTIIYLWRGCLASCQPSSAWWILVKSISPLSSNGESDESKSQKATPASTVTRKKTSKKVCVLIKYLGGMKLLSVLKEKIRLMERRDQLCMDYIRKSIRTMSMMEWANIKDIFEKLYVFSLRVL